MSEPDMILEEYVTEADGKMRVQPPSPQVAGSPRVTVRMAAEAMMKVIDQISQMDADGLRTLIKECDGMTQTNCWWLEYRLAPLVKQEAQEHLSFAENK